MKKRSLKFKLVVSGTLAVLLPVLVIGLFSASKATRALQHTSEEEVINLAKNQGEMIQLICSEQLNQVEQLSTTDTVRTALLRVKESGADQTVEDLALLDAMLARTYKTVSDRVHGIVIADAKGNVIASHPEQNIKALNIADLPHFKSAREGKPGLGRATRFSPEAPLVVPASVPVFDEGGEFIGAVVDTLKLDYIAKEISAMTIGKTGYGYLVNQEGFPLVHPNKDFILKLHMPSQKGMESFVKKALAGQSGIDYYIFNGIRKVSGYTPVPLTGWAVCFVQNEDEFLEPARAIRNAILLSGLGFIILMQIGVFFFARSLSTPINMIIASLNDGAEQVAAISGQVSGSSQALSTGASEQASAIEETSASLEEVSTRVTQHSQHATTADALMKKACQEASMAADSMDNLLVSMKNISKSSEETSKIIKTIDEIAFQTNLLALNAAIEAARAGEAGAGFAVVADEVRSLAMRSAEAARSTSMLLEDTVVKINEGAEVVSKTHEAFKNVTRNSFDVEKLVAEIAAACTEQAGNIEQITQAVSEIEKIVQQNASHAEESAAAGEEMNAQAVQMKEMVFDLTGLIRGGNHNGNGYHPTAPGPAVAPAERITPAVPKQQMLFLKEKRSPAQVIPLDGDDFQDF